MIYQLVETGISIGTNAYNFFYYCYTDNEYLINIYSRWRRITHDVRLLALAHDPIDKTVFYNSRVDYENHRVFSHCPIRLTSIYELRFV